MALEPLSEGHALSGSIASLHCLSSYDNKLGGSIHAALNVCKYLAIAGHSVEAVAPSAETDDIHYLSENYSEFITNKVARSFPERFSNSRALGVWLETNLPRFQVVEIHGIWVLASLQVARLCQSMRKPYFVRPHGSLDPFDLQKRALLKKVLGPFYVRSLLKNAAGVVCTASLEAERLVTYGADPKRIVMTLPVPQMAEHGNGQGFRLKHRIPADAQVVLFLSRVDYKKGLDFLIPALRRLKREFPKLWFVLAGTGSPEFLADLRHGLASVREFTSEVGFLSGHDKLDAFAAADAFVLPSLNENFGIVLIEAMHAGLPLLISDQVYIYKEIEEARAGLVCQTNEESVYMNLQELLSGRIDLKEMGARGQDLVRRRYRPEASTGALIQLYERTLSLTV